MIYLASAYSSPDAFVEEARYKQVAGLAAKLLRRGVAVYSPITACHYFAKEYKLPTDAGWWAWYNEQMLNLCGELWVYVTEDIKESKGVTKEIEYAIDHNIPITWVDGDGDEVPIPEAFFPLIHAALAETIVPSL